MTISSGTFKWELNATKKNITMLHAICNDDAKALLQILWNDSKGKDAMLEIVGRAVQKECTELCSKSPTLFHLPDGNARFLEEIEFDKLFTELHERSPSFSKFLMAAAYNERNLKRNSLKTKKSLTPSLVTAACILLNSRNETMNAIQLLNAMILKRGGAKQYVFKRFNARGICTAYNIALKYQLNLAKGCDDIVNGWKEDVEEIAETQKKDIEISLPSSILTNEDDESPLALVMGNSNIKPLIPALETDTGRCPHGYVLVGDNVDMRQKARHPSKSRGNNDMHGFNIFAVKKRTVDERSREPREEMENIIPVAKFLPSLNDNTLLREEFKFLIGKILAKHVPALSWMEDLLPKHLYHSNLSKVNRKTEAVSMKSYAKYLLSMLSTRGVSFHKSHSP